MLEQYRPWSKPKFEVAMKDHEEVLMPRVSCTRGFGLCKPSNEPATIDRGP